MIPTYDGKEKIVVQMLETIEINNLKYLIGKKYEIPYWIAKELNENGYCWYVIGLNLEK